MHLRSIVWVLPVVITALCSLSYQDSQTHQESALDLIKGRFLEDLQRFDTEAEAFAQKCQEFADGRLSPEDIQDGIETLRLRYKSIEYLAEYCDSETVKLYINGAPLPKVDPHVPGIEVIQPSGLQVLDEMAFAESIDTSELVDQAHKLLRARKDFVGFLSLRPLEHRYVFEACRSQILRVFSLGITGFDTPGSVNGIEESKVSLESVLFAFEQYRYFPQDAQDDILRSDIVSDLQEAIRYLEENNDFEKLDRAHFYRQYLGPLYGNIYRLQSAYQVEFIDEADKTNKAVNYHAESIWVDSFLFPSYYAQIAEQDLMDPAKIDLGRTLFFDPALSRNVKMSCASCHHPDKAFTDGLPRSQSNTPGLTTLRNAPTLVNSVYSTHYFWDLREYDLERQVKHVVMDGKEFDMDFVELADRLKESPEYEDLFAEAYGERDKYGISTWSISNALSAYVTSLSSWDSPFDRYMRGEEVEIAQGVIDGFNLFMGKASCGTCHFAPTFNGTVPPSYKDSESEILGVTVRFDTINPVMDRDLGRIANGVPRDEAPFQRHAFKTVTVRNAALTAPYMHNGGFSTLEEVVHFYNHGGGAGLGLDVPNQTLPDAHLGLTEKEIEALVTFMEHLTDIEGLTRTAATLPSFPGRPEWDNRQGTY